METIKFQITITTLNFVIPYKQLITKHYKKYKIKKKNDIYILFIVVDSYDISCIHMHLVVYYVMLLIKTIDMSNRIFGQLFQVVVKYIAIAGTKAISSEVHSYCRNKIYNQ
jgi:hypothetical protein